jgi:hypothetical protein
VQVQDEPWEEISRPKSELGPFADVTGLPCKSALPPRADILRLGGSSCGHPNSRNGRSIDDLQPTDGRVADVAAAANIHQGLAGIPPCKGFRALVCETGHYRSARWRDAPPR